MTARQQCREIRDWLAGRPAGELMWLFLLAHLATPRMKRLIREEWRRREK